MDAREKSIVTQVAAKLAGELTPYANPTAGGTGDVLATFNELFDGLTASLLSKIDNGSAGTTSTPQRSATPSANTAKAEEAFGAKTSGFVVIDTDGNEVTDYDPWLKNSNLAKTATLIKDVRPYVGDSNKPHYRVVEPKLEKDGIWPPKARA